jgi:rhodanese-related sulfurtransferase
MLFSFGAQMTRTLSGLLLVAAVATAGDYIWYTFGVRHSMTTGLIHGAILLTVVGGVLGAASGHAVKGLPIGMLAGLAGAACYYAIIAATRGRTYGAAIPASWMILWLMLAALDGRWLRAPHPRSWSSIAARGAIAAIAGGIAFYLVMTTLWGRPPAGGRNYFVQLLAWAFAWAPGLLALTMGDRGSGAPASTQRSDSGPRAGRSAAVSAGAMSAGAASAEEATEEATMKGSITAAELMARISAGEPLAILDVRSEHEFAAGHVPGAVNVPFNQVGARLDEVPGAAGEELIVYCGHGPRAYMAAVALSRQGRRRVVYLEGHWAGWERQIGG